ncbi:NAD(P)/FAD-dependent oxidoreductase [Tianweitania sediminis]|uniref:NADH:ubiquinone reductase (non-electrogenic) n=1 Tax=Tianweitania sediminis TaxID=1502156 RepID=A0A8J7RPW1_9HYPH|nr:NAD(P)/FAD-dependent oxidoreductase [Tianweitania sediminis]
MATGTAPSPRVVVVGGGFAGLACAKELGARGVDVTVIDRRNHNLFQPLLYQVATAALSPADIAEPLRKTLGRYEHVSVILAEVRGVDTTAKSVATDVGSVDYDHLVIATGSEYNYFGREDWRRVAPGLKSLEQARTLRQRLLLALEWAETTASSEERRALLTQVIIGGGPTGVEMAGAVAELGATVSRDFKNIRPEEFRVLLIEAGPRLLAAFPEGLSHYAKQQLEKLGVEVLLNTRVKDLTQDTVTFGDQILPVGSVTWGAGVKASSASEWLPVEPDRSGRIPVEATLQVKGQANVFALGDVALFLDEKGAPLPALAQVAKQQGQHLGKALGRHIKAGATLPPFTFRNRGNTAVIGRHAAVFDFGSWQLKGRLAWILWAIVHVYLLVSFEKRLLVSIQWLWRYVTLNRGARIIAEHARSGEDASPVTR